MNVAVAPSASLCAASTAIPAAAMPPPIMLCRVTRSCRSQAARPIVKNTWNWITREDRPGRHPEMHPEK